MTEERLLSSEETYAALLQVMRDVGLDWVAEEVEQAVRAGDVEIREAPSLPPGSEREAELRELRRIPSLAVIRTQFRPVDRVHIAVDALRRVVIEGSEIEDAVRGEFGAQLVMAEDDAQSEPVVVVRARTPEPNALERLRRLLDEVER